jgi:hypothetical protein
VSIAGNGAIAVLPVPTGGAYGFENLMPPRLPLLEAELATVATFASSRLRLDGKVLCVGHGDCAAYSNYNQAKTVHDQHSNYAYFNSLREH